MSQQALTGAQFKIVKSKDFYTIEGVKLPGGEYSGVQVTTELLNGGLSGTQEELAKTGLLGSAPLITALLTALYHNQDFGGVEELRQLFADGFGRGMMTSTNVTYRAGGLDLVTHDAGTLGQRTLEAKLVGPDGYVGAGMEGVTQALFGNGGAREVMDVYEWVTGRKPYLVRLNKQPEQDEKQALVLGLGFYIGASDYFNYIWPARGVRVSPQISTGNKG